MTTAWGMNLQRPLSAMQNLSTTWLSAELGYTSTEISKIKQTKTMQMQVRT